MQFVPGCAVEQVINHIPPYTVGAREVLPASHCKVQARVHLGTPTLPTPPASREPMVGWKMLQ